MTRLIILILTAIILYLSLWSTIIHYLVKMRTLTDMDKKLHFTYNNLGAVALEQIIALIAIIIFYAVRLNDIEIAVPEIAAIFFMVLLIIGFILTGYFWFVYRRKYFPEYVKKVRSKKSYTFKSHNHCRVCNICNEFWIQFIVCRSDSLYSTLRASSKKTALSDTLQNIHR